ncbi:hypothetical protein [Streptomyces blattellae]|uniref:hypothetical protein n=1 Tax=Streptomyces blattellae TaxID=2569855 RepID=UPI0012B72006|nr:hypothetical protein [Streptomyces blattellae]
MPEEHLVISAEIPRKLPDSWTARSRWEFAEVAPLIIEAARGPVPGTRTSTWPDGRSAPSGVHGELAGSSK